MRRNALPLVLGVSLLAGCADLAAGGGEADPTSPGTVRAALRRAGATTVELGEDQRPLLARFAGLPAGPRAVEAIAQAYGVAAADLTPTATDVDALGMRHERFQQFHDGLPVVGAELGVHSSATGEVVAAVSTLREVRPGAAPTVLAAAAEAIAAARYPDLAERTSRADGQAYVVDKAGVARLCQVVWVRGRAPEQPVIDEVFVDAASGEIVTVHPRVQTGQNRRTYSAGNTQNLPGTLRLSETQTSSGDTTLDTLHGNAGRAYRCAMTQFGRDSFDGAGAQIVASGHYDQGLINAFWDGTQLAFGDGDGRMSGPLVASDVVAHEFGHAITMYTSNLVYESQSGALNEGFSDIFAAMCDLGEAGGVTPKAWLVGEDVWTPGTPGDALRYMDDPSKDGYSADHVSGITPCATPSQDNDNCYVHSSSGIPNLAFKLLVTGGTHPRAGMAGIPATVQVPALGVDRAKAITYRAWTKYLTQSSNFVAARAAFKQAAQDLYASEAGTIAAVELAWYAVGVGAQVPNLPTGTGDPNATTPPPGPGPGPDPTPDPDPNPDPGQGFGSQDITGGCATTGGAGGWPALLLVGLAARRRRRG